MDEQMARLLAGGMAGGQGNDMTRLMLQLLQERMASRERRQADDEDDDEEVIDIARLQSEAVQLRERLTEMRRLNRALRRQVKLAAEFIADLGALLGACPACLGQNPACIHCQGEAGPGHDTPDPALADWIRPALARLRQPASTHITRTDPTPQQGETP
ncbi:hypothetical protein [Thiohalobacter sp.]|uniref:hypothetical protein n=1 Tax=Thiohalobacter sp. TaxID=2025948 RepID=UPI002622ECB2|nr:hypothetical protein [Thiohalobacter sp.]